MCDVGIAGLKVSLELGVVMEVQRFRGPSNRGSYQHLLHCGLCRCVSCVWRARRDVRQIHDAWRGDPEIYLMEDPSRDKYQRQLAAEDPKKVAAMTTD
jgi:hypothetical protein